jgi:hypothetical protein
LPQSCHVVRRVAAMTSRGRRGRLRSIFQSKDDPEIGFRFQYKMILET